MNHAAALSFVLACVLGAVLPAFHRAPSSESAQTTPAWPATLEGRPLTPQPLTDMDRVLMRDASAHVARFTDGSRGILLRQVDAASRQIHPSADCLRAAGFTVHEPVLWRDSTGAVWQKFHVDRDGEVLQILEAVVDADGQRFTDVSSWYWSALLRQSRGPWLMFTVSSTVE